VIAYWPALIHRSRVKAKVLSICTDGEEKFFEINFPVRFTALQSDREPKKQQPKRKTPGGKKREVLLQELCYARSGDKGDTCNIGVLARSNTIYDWLVEYLTPERVKKFFGDIVKGDVIRYRLDNLEGLNFLLNNALDGGGTESLMIDPQGKTLAQALLQMKVTAPVSIIPKRKRSRRK
jgi:hypothetical protein